MGAGEVAWFLFMEMDCFALCYFMCRKKHDGWLCDGVCGVVSFGEALALGGLSQSESVSRTSGGRKRSCWVWLGRFRL